MASAGYNSHKYRPEVMARRIADMSNPTWLHHREVYKAAKGKKRRRVAQWNADWNRAGRPRDFPDWPEYEAAHKDKWAQEDREARAYQGRLNRWHAAWVAAGMPQGFPNMIDWEAAQ